MVVVAMTSCNNESEQSTDSICGLWILEEIDNAEVLTDELFVLEFYDTGKELYAALETFGETDHRWAEGSFDYTFSNEIIHVTGKNSRGEASDITMKVESLDDSYLTYTCDGTRYKLRKAENKYTQSIVGLWEGKNVTPGIDETAKEAELHRWEYDEDGTYVYYYKDSESGEWIEKDDDCQYFIYGDLLASNWNDDYNIEISGRYSECWIIEIKEEGGSTVMNWEGHRANNSMGYFSMTKIEK